VGPTPAASLPASSRVCAVIVAGGMGRRFGGDTPKQYRLLAGVPLIVHTLRAFDGCAAIDRIVLVVPAGDVSRVAASLLPAAGLVKPVQLAAGGASRQESVFNGLGHVPEDVSLVAIHDAVRPLVTGACIAACIEGARCHGACIAALPAWDTLKRVDPDGSIRETLPRDLLWMAQTPQVFRLGLIREAHAAARRTGWVGTDDAELVERLGAPVYVVPGSRINFKITTPDDLQAAERLVHRTAALAR
jgi:2-C-methyl-D-erythritol 4-phosphate cytidylyltransferase